jgi:hypothetical protein
MRWPIVTCLFPNVLMRLSKTLVCWNVFSANSSAKWERMRHPGRFGISAAVTMDAHLFSLRTLELRLSQRFFGKIDG